MFGYGLDLLPDFGYPPVQYGGWTSEKANWYRQTAAHNTVMVDGTNDVGYEGKECVGSIDHWHVEDGLQYVTASCPDMTGVSKFSRTCALVDISEEAFFIIDIFRVKGGQDHRRVLHSHFGSISTQGLELKSSPDLFENSCLRNYKADLYPQPGWSIDWAIEDRLGYLETDVDLHLRMIDLTADAQAWNCEGWITYGGYCPSEEAWIPFNITRRKSDTPDLESTFVSVIEPYRDKSNILSANCINTNPDFTTVEVRLMTGNLKTISLPTCTAQ